MLNDTYTGFSNEHFFLIPDKIKVSHIILDHFIATLMAGHISHHMTKILISAKTQGDNLRMSHQTEAISKGPNQKWDFKSRNNSLNNAQWISVIVFPCFSKPSEGLIDYAKPLTVWITTNCGIFLEMGTPDYFTCLLRNLYAGQEATVRTGHGKMNWFQIGKGVHQRYIVTMLF